MVFIDQYIIQIGKDKYHHHSHELAEIKKIALANGRKIDANGKKLDKIIAGDTGDTGQPETEGYFSSIKITDGDLLITSIKGELNIMALELTNTQQASGVLTFKDKKLAITDVPDGNVTVASSDENVFTVGYEDPTNTVTVKAVNTGVASLKITAKNKAGVDLLFEDIAVEVKSGDAVTGGVAFGEPIEQPE